MPVRVTIVILFSDTFIIEMKRKFIEHKPLYQVSVVYSQKLLQINA